MFGRLSVALTLATALAASTIHASFAVPANAEDASPAPTVADAASAPRDLVSAALAARLTGVPVEVLDARTESTRTLANPDGTMTLEATAGPSRVRRGDGWVDIDTKLAAGSAGLRPLATLSDTLFSAGGSGPLATLATETGRIEMFWSQTLPAPVITGDTASYAQADGSTVVLKADPVGYEQSLHLATRPLAPMRIRLPMRLRGLKAEKTASGAVEFRSTRGRVEAVVEPPRMWDSQVNAATGDPLRTGSVAMSMSESPDGVVLELVPDPVFLADPLVKYPVIIDPAVRNAIVQSDTYIENDHSWNDSGQTELRAGRTTYNGNTVIARSLMTFYLQDLTNRRILNSKLRLFNTVSATCDPKPVSLYRVTQPYDMGNVTWATQPAVDRTTAVAQTYASYGAAGCPQNWIDFTGSGLVNAVHNWTHGVWGNYGVQVGAGESDATTWKKFNSGETSTQRPVLIVDYNSVPSVTQDGPSEAAQFTASPVLNATFSDADAEQGTLTYRVFNSSGTQVQSVTASSVGAGTTHSWQVPALGEGTYTWSVSATDGTDSAVTGRRSFTINNPPYVPSSFVPVSGTVVTTTTPTLSAVITDPSGDNVIARFVVQNLATGERVYNDYPVGILPSGSRAYFSVGAGKLSPASAYQWTVRAEDDKGGTSGYAPWQQFSIDVPPDPPTLSAPGHGEVVTTRTPTLSAVATDPGGGTLSTEFTVIDPGTGVTVTTGSGGSAPAGATVSFVVPTGKLSNSRTYRWSVRACDSRSQCATSTTRDFHVNEPLAGLPSDLLPSNQSVITTTTPTLSAIVSDPGGGSMTGRMHLQTSTGVDIVPETAGSTVPSGGRSVYQVAAGKLSSGGQYRWRLKACNATECTNYTAFAYFSVNVSAPPPSNVAPDAPELAAPAEGATVTSRTPTLSAVVRDADGGNLTTQFTVLDSGGATVTTAAGETVASGKTASFIVPGGLLTNGQSYSWRVRVCDAAPLCTTSTVTRAFTVSEPIAGMPTQLQPAAGSALSTATPTLSAIVSEPNGGAVTGRVHLQTAAGADVVADGAGTTTSSGGRSTYQVPAGLLANGGSYRWRIKACTGAACTAYTNFTSFTVDLTSPASPSVTSALYPTGKWVPTSQLGRFDFTTTSTDVVKYLYGLDGPATTETGPYIQLTPAVGYHQLRVRAVDAAGNLSPESFYPFGVGRASIERPAAGEPARSTLALSASSNAPLTVVTWRYRRTETQPWADIPPGSVYDSTNSDGTQRTSWPQPVTSGASGATSIPYIWRAATVLPDGPLQVQACFKGSNTTELCAAPVGARLDRNAHGSVVGSTKAGPPSAALTASGFDPASMGPGSVNLLTGNYELGATDVSIEAFGSDLSVSRVFQSSTPDVNSTGMFGPGWSASTPIYAADAGWQGLAVGEGYVTVTADDGTLLNFIKQPDGTFTPEPQARGLVLSASGTSYRLSDPDGNTTTFVQLVTGAWQPSSVEQVGSINRSTYTYDGAGRLVLMVAPVAPGTSCPVTGAWDPACRGLEFSYHDNGRLREVRLKTTDSDGNVASEPVAAYRYDPSSSARLVAAWDPRISPTLEVTYGYDAAGRVNTVTPPGERPWSFNYDSLGRIKDVQRLMPDGSLARSTVVYGVPLSGAQGLPTMTSGAVAAWGQTTPPVTATAMFSPDRPWLNDGNFTFATVAYLDAEGRTVNAVRPGKHVTTTQFDPFGNVRTMLTASNRAKALATGPDSVTTSIALSSHMYYSPDGVDLIDSYGPTRHVKLPSGQIEAARLHTHTVYATGAEPGHPGGQLRRPVRTTSGASISDQIPSPSPEVDVRVTTMEYSVGGDSSGWALRRPLRTTVDPGAGRLSLATTTLYDPVTGLPTESRLPAGPGGGTAHTTRTYYYTAGAHPVVPACGNRPAWVHLVCQTGPAAQPTASALPALPTTRALAYNRLLLPTMTVETTGDAARTTTTEYDTAGRVIASTVHGVGTALPTVRTEYDPATGRAARTSAGSESITRRFDNVGRLESYTDSTGITSTFRYDVAGRPTETFDGAGRTYFVYDRSVDPRGLLTSSSFTSVSTGGAAAPGGAFSASYDPDGALWTQTYPNGLVAITTRDATGAPVELSYERNGAVWLKETVAESVHGQWRAHGSAISVQDYDYDPAGRLTQVEDLVNGTGAGSGCTVRGYSFDDNSNRIALRTIGPRADGGCDRTGTPQVVNRRYDEADRLIDAGYRYDEFGRITEVPAVDAGRSVLRASYYANDMVASLETPGGSTTSAGGSVSVDRRREWRLDPARRLVSHSDGPATTGGGGSSTATSRSGAPNASEIVQVITGIIAELVTIDGLPPVGELPDCKPGIPCDPDTLMALVRDRLDDLKEPPCLRGEGLCGDAIELANVVVSIAVGCVNGEGLCGDLVALAVQAAWDVVKLAQACAASTEPTCDTARRLLLSVADQVVSVAKECVGETGQTRAATDPNGTCGAVAKLVSDTLAEVWMLVNSCAAGTHPTCALALRLVDDAIDDARACAAGGGPCTKLFVGVNEAIEDGKELALSCVAGTSPTCAPVTGLVATVVAIAQGCARVQGLCGQLVDTAVETLDACTGGETAGCATVLSLVESAVDAAADCQELRGVCGAALDDAVRIINDARFAVLACVDGSTPLCGAVTAVVDIAAAEVRACAAGAGTCAAITQTALGAVGDVSDLARACAGGTDPTCQSAVGAVRTLTKTTEPTLAQASSMAEAALAAVESCNAGTEANCALALDTLRTAVGAGEQPSGQAAQTADSSVPRVTVTNHYSGDGDRPAWTTEDDEGRITRPIAGIDENLAVVQNTATGTSAIQLTNLHGDVVATVMASGNGLASTVDYTEYGQPRSTASAGTNPRYGWLGAHQRSADSLGGTILMGVRLYVPSTGRFLQVDPVVGGSCNAYDYTCADSINKFDLDGEVCFKCAVRKAAKKLRKSRRLALKAGGSVIGAVDTAMDAYDVYKGRWRKAIASYAFGMAVGGTCGAVVLLASAGTAAAAAVVGCSLLAVGASNWATRRM